MPDCDMLNFALPFCEQRNVYNSNTYHTYPEDIKVLTYIHKLYQCSNKTKLRIFYNFQQDNDLKVVSHKCLKGEIKIVLLF